ncbi:MAG: potassium transporter TrkG, partial [Planctomycetaceae bacterium]
CVSAVAATINGVGPGLGLVGPTQTFAPMTSFGKLILTALMLLGRLELYAILVLFVPSFWQHR